jgi:arginine deiminase
MFPSDLRIAECVEVLDVDEITLIPTGNGDIIDGAREQWNDGSNTLCIRPGVVVTYDRNYVSNQLLREHGIKVIEIPGSELVRGRGGLTHTSRASSTTYKFTSRNFNNFDTMLT